MNAPQDLKYTKSHEWIRVEEGSITVGITDFAQEHNIGILTQDRSKSTRKRHPDLSIGLWNVERGKLEHKFLVPEDALKGAPENERLVYYLKISADQHARIYAQNLIGCFFPVANNNMI